MQFFWDVFVLPVLSLSFRPHFKTGSLSENLKKRDTMVTLPFAHPMNPLEFNILGIFNSKDIFLNLNKTSFVFSFGAFSPIRTVQVFPRILSSASGYTPRDTEFV